MKKYSAFIVLILVCITLPFSADALTCPESGSGSSGLIKTQLSCQPTNPKCQYVSATVTIGGDDVAASCQSRKVDNPQPCYNKLYSVGVGGGASKEINCSQNLSNNASNNGGSLMETFGKLAGQLLQQMMGKQSSGGSSSGATPTGYETGTVNTATTDTVLNSLKTDSVSDINAGEIEGAANSNYDSLLDKFFDSNPPEVKETATKGSADQQPSENGEGGAGVPSGEDATKSRPAGIGSVRADESGALITVDVSGDSKNGVVGFFGSVGSTFSKATTPIGKLCSARPWSGSLVSKVIPETFFDGLCQRFGYTPGAPIAESDTAPMDTSAQERVMLSADRIRNARPSAPTRGITCEPGIIDLGSSATVKWSCGRAQLAQVSNFAPTENGDPAVVTPRTTTTYGIVCDDKVAAQCTVQVVNPRLTIWSEPKSTVLGTRATVFWNAQDVTSCTVDGPSFHETGVQGGASTVPITEATTYTMECQSISGATTTKDLIIDLAL